jgi:hypothetical protein
MNPWAKNPLIYENNTWVWLNELSRKADRTITLASVPDEEWDRIASLGFDVIWLMGVWERSSEGIRIAMANEGLCCLSGPIRQFRHHDLHCES